ncbi:MAG: MBL fold metallo-hydrolase [Rikenellaceae bacterium]
MNIAVLVFNPIQENTYVLWDDTLECVVVDAGMSNEKEYVAMENFIAEKGLKPVLAVNTHGHFDHAMGVEFLKEKYGVKFAMSSKDMFLIEAQQEGSVVYGVTVGKMPKGVDVDLSLAENKELKFGHTTLEVIATPGHTPGHVSLFEPKQRVLFTGDTLFKESVGRTDLPGGDYAQLMDSLLTKIVPLGDDVVVYPGHSGDTTIGQECMYNPFIVEVINKEVNY